MRVPVTPLISLSLSFPGRKMDRTEHSLGTQNAENFAKYAILKIKRLTSTERLFGEPGKRNYKMKHTADHQRVVFFSPIP